MLSIINSFQFRSGANCECVVDNGLALKEKMKCENEKPISSFVCVSFFLVISQRHKVAQTNEILEKTAQIGATKKRRTQ